MIRWPPTVPARQPPERLHVTSPSRTRTEAVVVGVDYGTLSGRAVVVRVSDGQELGSAVHDYPHAVLDAALPTGQPLRPEWALQVPADYLTVLQVASVSRIASRHISGTLPYCPASANSAAP